MIKWEEVHKSTIEGLNLELRRNIYPSGSELWFLSCKEIDMFNKCIGRCISIEDAKVEACTFIANELKRKSARIIEKCFTKEPSGFSRIPY